MKTAWGEVLTGLGLQTDRGSDGDPDLLLKMAGDREKRMTPREDPTPGPGHDTTPTERRDSPDQYPEMKGPDPEEKFQALIGKGQIRKTKNNQNLRRLDRSTAD